MTLDSTQTNVLSPAERRHVIGLAKPTRKANTTDLHGHNTYVSAQLYRDQHSAMSSYYTHQVSINTHIATARGVLYTIQPTKQSPLPSQNELSGETRAIRPALPHRSQHFSDSLCSAS
jgi:hypothetical protein